MRMKPTLHGGRSRGPAAGKSQGNLCPGMALSPCQEVKKTVKPGRSIRRDTFPDSPTWALREEFQDPIKSFKFLMKKEKKKRKRSTRREEKRVPRVALP